MRFYLSELSLRRTIRQRGLVVADLPAFARDSGFDGLELSDRTLLSCDAGGRRAFSANRHRANCGFVFGIGCDLTRSDPQASDPEVDHVLGMIELARELDAEAARIWLGGQSLSLQRLRRRPAPGPRIADRAPHEPAGHIQRTLSSRWLADAAHAVRVRLPARVLGERRKLLRAVAALRRIMPRAEEAGLHLAIQNHWGLSSRPENILAVLIEVPSQYLGTCPDFGNFPRQIDRYEALRRLAPRALLVHAQSARFDALGKELEIDYPRCLGILRASGYAGPFTVKYVGPGDELAGCALTRELLRASWAAAG